MSAQTPTTKRLAEILRAQARQIAKAPDKRPEDFEDAAVVWALRTAATRLLMLERKERA